MKKRQKMMTATDSSGRKFQHTLIRFKCCGITFKSTVAKEISKRK
jgi:hypothetical protein